MIFNIITTPFIERTNNYFTRLILHSLNDLGHKAIVSNGLPLTGAMDVVYAIHLYSHPNIHQQLLDRGNGYIIYFQEIFQDYGINQMVMSDANKALFHAAIRDARLVLSPYLESVARLKAINPAVAYCPLAFHPKLEIIERSDSPLFDIFFFGGKDQSGRRETMFRRIAERGFSLVRLGPDATLASRDSLIASSRLCINIAQNLTVFRHASPRVPFLANNRVCCPSNRSEDPDGYLAYAVTFDSDDALLDGCRALVDTRRFRSAGDDCYERFRTTSSTRAFETALSLLTENAA